MILSALQPSARITSEASFKLSSSTSLFFKPSSILPLMSLYIQFLSRHCHSKLVTRSYIVLPPLLLLLFDLFLVLCFISAYRTGHYSVYVNFGVCLPSHKSFVSKDYLVYKPFCVYVDTVLASTVQFLFMV